MTKLAVMFVSKEVGNLFCSPGHARTLPTPVSEIIYIMDNDFFA